MNLIKDSQFWLIPQQFVTFVFIISFFAREREKKKSGLAYLQENAGKFDYGKPIIADTGMVFHLVL